MKRCLRYLSMLLTLPMFVLVVPLIFLFIIACVGLDLWASFFTMEPDEGHDCSKKALEDRAAKKPEALDG